MVQNLPTSIGVVARPSQQQQQRHLPKEREIMPRLSLPYHM